MAIDSITSPVNTTTVQPAPEATEETTAAPAVDQRPRTDTVEISEEAKAALEEARASDEADTEEAAAQEVVAERREAQEAESTETNETETTRATRT